MTLLLTGPQQLVLIRDQNARGYNHNERFTSTVQASISLTLWCLGLILAVSTRGKYLKADQKKGRAHNSKTQFFLREDDRMTSASRNAANLVRELVIKAYQRFTKTCERTATETVDDLTIIAHTGCCQCGAVQFQVRT